MRSRAYHMKIQFARQKFEFVCGDGGCERCLESRAVEGDGAPPSRGGGREGGG